MSGDATFSGTNYQAAVVAYVYVHILAERRLGWLPPHSDIPSAVSGEVKGPGDDARIEFGVSLAPAEIQAKHGLTAGGALAAVLGNVRRFSAAHEQDTPVILAVDRSSTRFIYTALVVDLERIRTGRLDALRADTKKLLDSLGADGADHLQRLRPVPIDLEHAHQPETKFVLDLLAQLLETPAHVEAVWDLLRTDAADLCGKRLRRNRSDIVALLAGRGFTLKPPGPLQRIHAELNFSKTLLQQENPDLAQAVLDQIETNLSVQAVDAPTRYRYHQQRAAAYFQQGREQLASDSAKRALEHDHSGVEALNVLAAVSVQIGNLAEAEQYAVRATNSKPTDQTAWVVTTYVAMAAGTPAPQVPPHVADTSDFRLGLAQLSLAFGEIQRALDLTTSLLRDGMRSWRLLMLRIQALSAGLGSDSSLDATVAEDIERLSTELLDSDNRLVSAVQCRILLARAAARAALGKRVEHDADIALAETIDPANPDVILQSAQLKMDQRDFATALQIVQRPAVESSPLLRAIRAQVLVQKDQTAEARTEIAFALSHAGGTASPDKVRLVAAEAATSMHDIELAERALDGLTEAAKLGAHYALVRGRIAMERGQADEAERFYHDAASKDPSQAADCLGELGSRLLEAGFAEKAVEVFETTGNLPTLALPVYLRALFAAGELPKAAKLLEITFEQQAIVPDWALAHAAHLAMLREDHGTLVRHLEELVQRGRATVSAELQLVFELLEIRDQARAADLVRSMPQRHALSAKDNMARAQLLGEAGYKDEALALGYEAFRSAPEDAAMHRGLIGLALFNGVIPPTVDHVAVETTVRLRDIDDGSIREYTIRDGPTLNPFHGELRTAAAEQMGLLGRRVNDVVTMQRLAWEDRRLRIERILPAAQHAVHDAMQHYEDRFPSEPFFLTSFKLGESPTIKDLAPIVGSVHAQRDFASQILQLYNEQALPLGFVAQSLGRSIAEVMRHLATANAVPNVLMTEWPDVARQLRSRSAAFGASSIVLTESAIETGRSLGILELTADHYQLLVPPSLRASLRRQLKIAEEAVRDGVRQFQGGGGRVSLQELEAGHPVLIEEHDRLVAVIDWLERCVKVEPRPLESIDRPGSVERQLRQTFGRSSADAIGLAVAGLGSLYADDLGLRRLLPAEPLHRSFSTIALLSALMEKRAMTIEEGNRHLLSLIQQRHAVLLPTTDLLEAAVRSLPSNHVHLAFDLIGSHVLSAAEAGAVVAMTLRRVATQVVQTMSIGTLCKVALAGMSQSWPPRLCVFSLMRAADDTLAFLPTQLGEVRRACAEFLESTAA